MFEVWTYPRPGYHVTAETLAEVWPPEMAEVLVSRCIAGAQTDAASSSLREELKNGRIPEGLLTPSVLEYIKMNHLYGGVVK